VTQAVRRLLRHSAVYAMASGLQRMAGFLLIPLYTRVLAVEDYGVLEILLALSSSGFVLASLGLTSALNKCYHRDCRDEEEKRTLMGTMIWLVVPASALTVMLGLVLGRPLARGLLGDPGGGGLVALALLSTAAFTLSQIPLSLLRAREMSVAYSMLSIGQFLVMASLNIWLVGFRGRGIAGVLWGATWSSIVVLLASTPLLVRHASPRFSTRFARLLLAFGVPMIPVAISAWVMNLSDRWFLELLSDRRQVGLYGLGYRFGMLVEVMLVLPFQMAWPAFYFREAARPDARELYARVTTWFAVIGGWITVSVALGGEVVLKMMCERSFWDGAVVIPLVALAYFLNGFQYCVVPGVHLGGRTRLLPGLALLAAAVNVVLNLIWIPPYGMMGAAWATLISFVVLCALTAMVSVRAWRFRFETRRLTWVLSTLVLLIAAACLLRFDSLIMDILVRGMLEVAATTAVVVWCMRELGLGWGGFVEALRGRLWPGRLARSGERTGTD